jgi:hypothetical protein
VRARAREFIEEMIRGELDTVVARPRYGRGQVAGNEGRTGIAGHRHGSRTRLLTGTFGPIEIAVPRARLNTLEGKTTEWKSPERRVRRKRIFIIRAPPHNVLVAGSSPPSSTTQQTFEYGTWGGEIRAEFVPEPGEIVATEHWCSSGFANTDLERYRTLRWRHTFCGCPVPSF